jgi:tetraacyldisaccharide 4'-kinase
MWVRNTLFDWGIKKQTKVKATVISVGNLSMGGTGKSPHVEWIANHLRKSYQTAILSRGYGRKSKGFVRVLRTSKSQTVGDEALYYKSVFEDTVEVAVCEKRVEGAQQLLRNNPLLDLIVLDDAYQHRYIQRDVNVLLTDFNHLFCDDYVVPTGNLREFRTGKNRADVVIVTKCPEALNQNEKKRIEKRLDLKPNTAVFFSEIVYGKLRPINSADEFSIPDKILLVTGIANPKPLEEYLSKIAEVQTLRFGDHHDFTAADISRIHNKFDTFAEEKKCIITTSKDYVRLINSIHEQKVKEYPWFYQEITVQIDEEAKLLKKIKSHVKAS